MSGGASSPIPLGEQGPRCPDAGSRSLRLDPRTLGDLSDYRRVRWGTPTGKRETLDRATGSARLKRRVVPASNGRARSDRAAQGSCQRRPRGVPLDRVASAAVATALATAPEGVDQPTLGAGEANGVDTEKASRPLRIDSSPALACVPQTHARAAPMTCPQSPTARRARSPRTPPGLELPVEVHGPPWGHLPAFGQNPRKRPWSRMLGSSVGPRRPYFTARGCNRDYRRLQGAHIRDRQAASHGLGLALDVHLWATASRREALSPPLETALGTR